MYIVIALVSWTICSIAWYVNALGRKHREPSTVQNIFDHFFAPPALAVATVFGFVMYADHKRNAYWVFAQFVRLMLLPVVIPVRIYEHFNRDKHAA